MPEMYRTSTTALVKMKIQYCRFPSVLITRVETTNGQVTLEGMAGNEAERVSVTKCVQEVYGVESVVNNMTIEESRSKTQWNKRIDKLLWCRSSAGPDRQQG